MKPDLAHIVLSPFEIRQRLQTIAQEVDVATTHSALLHEDALIQKRLREEQRALEEKAQALRDDTEFREWKAKEDRKEKEARENLIVQRKLDMMQADEDARKAKRKLQKANLRATHALRANMVKFNEERSAAQLRAEEERRENAKTLKAVLAENVDSAKTQLTAKNSREAAAIKNTQQAMELKVAAAMELERERKQEMIREIKETHDKSLKLWEEQRSRRRDTRVVNIDGIVSMTFDELKAKLQEVREEQRQLEMERRTGDQRQSRSAKNCLQRDDGAHPQPTAAHPPAESGAARSQTSGGYEKGRASTGKRRKAPLPTSS